MKYLTICFILFSISDTLYSQTNKEETRQELQSEKKNDRDCLLMKNNRMFLIVQGQMTALNQDYQLKNGDLVTKEGNVIRKDGSSKQMKNGDCVTLSGIWSHEQKNEKVRNPEDSGPDQ